MSLYAHELLDDSLKKEKQHVIVLGAGLLRHIRDHEDTSSLEVAEKKKQQDARFFAKDPPSKRPNTFICMNRKTMSDSPHIITGAAGVQAVSFESWDDAWVRLFGKWW